MTNDLSQQLCELCGIEYEKAFMSPIRRTQTINQRGRVGV